ncbi:MAG: helix-turn-helix transcriptional regulator [Actinobacteria bacterium]|nr:helix-turn-helix transcriptional regulator [Actinomycetota bacterium]
MEPDVRFTEVDGSRVAYATVGDGPLLVFGATFVSHVELEWREPLARAFYEQLAQTHRVVRYDRLGVGLSDRDVEVEPSAKLEARTLAAVIEAQDAGPASVFATSCASIALATLAVERPELVERGVFFGGYVKRHDIPEAARRSLVEFVRSNWALAGRMFAGLKHPGADRDAVDRFARYLRASADPEVAARYLELDLFADLTDLLPRVEIPALVVHRRGDRVCSIARGRELAALLPNARFVPLSGEAHISWLEDTRELRRALAGFLGEPVPETADDSPLSYRETEVLRLVAEGLSNREIAGSLVLSEHTVHRHVANILRKLGQSTRAAAAAQAARAGIV